MMNGTELWLMVEPALHKRERTSEAGRSILCKLNVSPRAIMSKKKIALLFLVGEIRLVINDRIDNKEQKSWLLHLERWSGAWTLQNSQRLD